MPVGNVTLVVGTVVSVGVIATGLICLNRSTIHRTIKTIDRRLLDIAPYGGVVVVALGVKQLAHGPSVALSRAIDWDITPFLYHIEGAFVANLQALTPDPFVPVFSAFYIFGFAYLVVTPLVLYFLGSNRRALKELLVAYALNALLGLGFYTLFVARGPRLYLGDSVSGLLFQYYPQVRSLTGSVSVTTNVFPSLHTSLSVIVLLFAWQTRHSRSGWFRLAVIVASGVVLSTMILGIHWLVDVLAGVFLAIFCVIVAKPFVSRFESIWRTYRSDSTSDRYPPADSDH